MKNPTVASMLAVLALVATMVGVFIAVDSSNTSERTERLVTRVIEREYVQPDTLVYIGSDRINVYHVVQADQSIAYVRRVAAWPDLKAVGCESSNVRIISRPQQRIRSLPDYEPGEFPGSGSC